MKRLGLKPKVLQSFTLKLRVYEEGRLWGLVSVNTADGQNPALL